MTHSNVINIFDEPGKCCGTLLLCVVRLYDPRFNVECRPAHFCCGSIKGSMCLRSNVLLSPVRYRPHRNDFKCVDEWMKGWTVGQTAWQLSQCNSIIGTGTGELRSCAARTTKDRPSHFTPRFNPSPYNFNRSDFSVRTPPSPSQNTRWLVKPTKKTKQQKPPISINDNVSPPTPTQTVHTSARRLETQTCEITPYRPRSRTQHSVDGSTVHPRWSLLLPVIIIGTNFWRKVCAELESRRDSSI